VARPVEVVNAGFSWSQ